MELTGCGTALVTPFTADGALDEAALEQHVRWQIESGIHFLVPAGTTGETPTLSDSEWLRVVEITVQVAAGRVPVIAGCTHNNTREAVERVARLSQIKGLTGVLTANPYYNKPSQEGQYQHFKAIAEATPLPVVLYNIPSRTGVNMEPTTVVRLAAIKNVIAVKESSGNIVQIAEVISRVPAGFSVLAGDDAFALPVISIGGKGLISVASNELPARMATMVGSALDGKWDTARAEYHSLLPLMQANFWEPSPSPVKAVMAMMGRMSETLRLPLTPVTATTRAKLGAVAAEYGLLKN